MLKWQKWLGPALVVMLVLSWSVLLVGSSASTSFIGSQFFRTNDPNEKIWVPIVNKFMDREELAQAIKAEGTVVIGDWTYLGATSSVFVPDFKAFIKEQFGVDIDVKWLGTQAAKGSFPTMIMTSMKAGEKSPIDVVHLEKNWFDYARSKSLCAAYLPSPLVPNLNLVNSQFIELPYGVAFQADAAPAVGVNTKYAPWIHKLTDLADPRLKGKLLLTETSDNSLWGFFIGICKALGGDYHNPNDMNKAIDFVAQKIDPNVLKYTSSESDIYPMLERGTVWAALYWTCIGHVEYGAGRPWIKNLIPPSGMIPLNGWAWIPKNVAHPILAQLAVDYLLSPRHQFPNLEKWSKVLDKGTWMIIHEGLLGPAYEQYIPDWFKADYYKVFPTWEQIEKYFKPMDWTYIMEQAPKWVNRYEKEITK